MNELINVIGGYDSYMFAILSIGCFVIGGVITGFWKWFFPVPSFGALLVFSSFTYQVSQLESLSNSFINGLASIIPFVFLMAAFLTIYWLGFCKKKGNKETQSIISDSVRFGKEKKGE